MPLQPSPRLSSRAWCHGSCVFFSYHFLRLSQSRWISRFATIEAFRMALYWLPANVFLKEALYFLHYTIILVTILLFTCIRWRARLQFPLKCPTFLQFKHFGRYSLDGFLLKYFWNMSFIATITTLPSFCYLMPTPGACSKVV